LFKLDLEFFPRERVRSMAHCGLESDIGLRKVQHGAWLNAELLYRWTTKALRRDPSSIVDTAPLAKRKAIDTNASLGG
jgi:hypothetical protein